MAHSRLMWLQCCLVFAICLGIFGVIGFIVSIVHNGEKHPGDVHTFCFAAEGNVANNPQTTVGRFAVDVEKKRICWDLLYRTAPFCDVAWIRLKGPVNEDDALEPANILANFSGPSSPDVLIINGTEEHSACAHISSANLRTLLRNPAFHYVQMKTIGEEGPHEGCSTANVRDYVTGLCHHQDFELDMIDDDDSQNDDDDSHHHHHHHEHGSDSSDHDDDDEPTILHAKHGLHASAQFRKAHNGARGRH